MFFLFTFILFSYYLVLAPTLGLKAVQLHTTQKTKYKELKKVKRVLKKQNRNSNI